MPGEAHELARAALAEGQWLRLHVSSHSMSPLLRPGDELEVTPVNPADLPPGGLVVRAVPGDGFIVHRLLDVRDGFVVTRGDSQPEADSPWPMSQLAGRVTAAWRAGRPIRLDATWPLYVGRILAGISRLRRFGRRLPGWVILIGLVLVLTCSFTRRATAAVTLLYFIAGWEPGDLILVLWETSTELNNRSFRLYRATAEAGPYGAPIYEPAARGDGITGALYEYWDLDVVPGVTYYYKLEDLQSDGTVTTHGPIRVDPEQATTPTATIPPSPTATRTGGTGAGPTPSGTATRTPTATATPVSIRGPALTHTSTPLPTATSSPLLPNVSPQATLTLQPTVRATLPTVPTQPGPYPALTTPSTRPAPVATAPLTATAPKPPLPITPTLDPGPRAPDSGPQTPLPEQIPPAPTATSLTPKTPAPPRPPDALSMIGLAVLLGIFALVIWRKRWS